MDTGVTQRVLGKTLDLVNCFCGIGMPDKFRVQIARVIGRLQGEAEVIHREHVFEELGFLEVTNATGLASRVELMSQCIGARVEIMIVPRFVYANAP